MSRGVRNTKERKTLMSNDCQSVNHPRIPDEEFAQRIARIQKALAKQNLDGLLVFGHEAEPADIRYLSDYWPSFETAGVLIPATGEACLLIGPESRTYAGAHSRLKTIRQLMDFRESSLPDYPGSTLMTWRDLFSEFRIHSLGITGYTMLPTPIYRHVVDTLGGDRVRLEDRIIRDLRMVKSENELAIHRRAYRMAEAGLQAAIRAARPGMTEIELVAEAEYAMLKAGAETTGYPIWCCSGPRSKQAISRPTHRRLQSGEIIQLCVGARLEGYSSSVGRALIFGKPSPEIQRFVDTGLAAEQKALEIIKAGRTGAEITAHVHDYIRAQGYGESILYGPAHGTGLMECEYPFIESSLSMPLVPNMVFGIDVFIATPEYGLRIEDGIVVTTGGVEELSSHRRELIVL
ncbi:MAG: Xaa-Pro peptidase family protein [Kiritimatiellae bacterium]|nr:Xaa-Pro peptidase family protein [Kiritimatiellia bacterium]